MLTLDDLGHLLWGGYFDGGPTSGLVVNLFISIFALLIGGSIGIVLGIVRGTTPVIIYAPLSVILGAIRSTPLLLLVLWVFLFCHVVIGLRVDPLWPGCVALAVYAMTHVSDIVRGGTLAVSSAQRRTAQGLGLTWYSMNRYVVGPIALRVSGPALATFATTLFKDSSVCYVIGVIELTQLVMFASTRHPNHVLEYQTAGALIFLAVSLAGMKAAEKIQTRYRLAGALTSPESGAPTPRQA